VIPLHGDVEFLDGFGLVPQGPEQGVGQGFVGDGMDFPRSIAHDETNTIHRSISPRAAGDLAVGQR
jgi:hypothetical protein